MIGSDGYFGGFEVGEELWGLQWVGKNNGSSMECARLVGHSQLCEEDEGRKMSLQKRWHLQTYSTFFVSRE